MSSRTPLSKVIAPPIAPSRPAQPRAERDEEGPEDERTHPSQTRTRPPVLERRDQQQDGGAEPEPGIRSRSAAHVPTLHRQDGADSTRAEGRGRATRGRMNVFPQTENRRASRRSSLGSWRTAAPTRGANKSVQKADSQ